MKRKTMLLAAAALSVLAFTALPSMASASEPPTITVEGTTAFVSVSGPGVLYTASGRKVECKTDVNVGSIHAGGQSGWVIISFHECRESTLNSKCTTSGEASGTITTEELPLETVYLSDGEPGMVIKPNEENGKFAEFSCVGGFVKVVVKGSGVLGRVTSPGFEEPSNTSVLDVSATEEGQEYTETDTGATYGLESNTNGGAFEPAYENGGEDEITFAEGMEPETLP